MGGNIMTLAELQEKLGEQISILSDDSIDYEKRRNMTDVAMTISSLAKQMINNADVVLRSEKLMAEGKLNNSNISHMIGK
jgi:hypothetical protein